MLFLLAASGLLLGNGVFGQQTNCTGAPDRLISYSCRVFTGCRNQTFVVEQCPQGQYLNIYTFECDYPANVPAPCGLNRNCEGQPDGRYPDYWNNCTSFYTCVNNRWLGTAICPGDLVFDVIDEACDWKYNTCPPCGTGVSLPGGTCEPTSAQPPYTGSTVTTDEMTTEEFQARNCTGLVDGYYPDLESDCINYYRCIGGSQVDWDNCRRGTVFDPVDNICDFPANTCKPCGTGESVEVTFCKNCSGMANGVYADTDVNCAGYYTCYGGVMRANSKCQPNWVFDPERGACTNETEDVCPPCYNGSNNPPERCFPTTEASETVTADITDTVVTETIQQDTTSSTAGTTETINNKPDRQDQYKHPKFPR